MRAGALAAALALAAAPAAAQVPGLPVFNSGVTRGVMGAVDVGFPNDDAGGGTTFAGTVSYGASRFMLTGTIASWNPDAGDGTVAFGGTGSLHLIGGPLSPLSVTLQAGVASWSQDVGPEDASFLHVPVGVGVGLVIPSPAVSLKPWIAPRLDLAKTDLLPNDDWESSFGLSAGLDVAFIGGFGLRAAYDRVYADDADPSVFSLGLNYLFSMPGL
ncbi:MAG TPA: outer membrane beta-barrel protein [Gemmatimonadales bacterium]|nr:outer membrane beta-barrel protein [Gemmatimonadales bacterium]